MFLSALFAGKNSTITEKTHTANKAHKADKNFTNECGIYCFTNKVNGKCYVGQAINLKKRLRSHYSTFRKQNVPNMILYTAVEKYGLDNFELDILEYCDPNLTLKELKSLLEIYNKQNK